MPDDNDRPQPQLDHGIEPESRRGRAGKWAAFIAALHVIAAFEVVLLAFSLVALGCIVAGIFFVVRSIVDDRIGFATGIVGGALIVAGGTLLWLIQRLDLD